jgi:hypothetical protein
MHSQESQPRLRRERQPRLRRGQLKWVVGGIIAGTIVGFAAGFLVCFLVTATLPPRPAETTASAQATTAPAGPSVTPVQVTNVLLQDLVNPGSAPSVAPTQRVTEADKKL